MSGITMPMMEVLLRRRSRAIRLEFGNQGFLTASITRRRSPGRTGVLPLITWRDSSQRHTCLFGNVLSW